MFLGNNESVFQKKKMVTSFLKFIQLFLIIYWFGPQIVTNMCLSLIVIVKGIES